MYAERITVAIRMAAAETAMFDDVVVSNNKDLVKQLFLWSRELRRAAEMEEKEKEEQKRQRAAERRKAELAMKKAEEVWPLCVRLIAAFTTHSALSAGSVETGG